MHPRSIYHEHPPDFASLAKLYPSIAKFVVGNTIDFKDPAAAREVTRVLLLHDFQLSVSVPEDRLCPPVPNRLNYIHWIEDLVSETTNGDEAIVGIDVGTGAIAIYPLLGCRLHPSWTFYALESDARSIQSAAQTVKENQLTDRITLLESNPNDTHLLTQHDRLKPHGADSDGSIATFTMCNPPFYESLDDMHRSASLKSDASLASGSCTASSCETITPGGEVGFTKSLIAESIILRGQVRWYTTMLGKLSSVKKVVEELRELGIGNYAVTELVQGSTRRWAVGWSFTWERPAAGTARGCTSSQLQALALPNPVFRVTPKDSEMVVDRLRRFLEEVGCDWRWIEVKKSIEVLVVENTWSRSALRRKEHLKRTGQESTTEGPCCMRVRVTHDVDQDVVELIWRYGIDSVLWESFCGKVKQFLAVHVDNGANKRGRQDHRVR